MKVYVAGPYSADTEEGRIQNTTAAIEAGLELYRLGHWPYIPHLTHWVGEVADRDGKSLSWDEWMEWDDQWLQQCDALLYLAPSRGADVELGRAHQLGLRVYRSVAEVPIEGSKRS